MVDVARLKAKMVEKGFTQEKLAKMMNLDKSTLNRKINNVDGKAITVREAALLAEILSIDHPEEYFFCRQVA